ncbi:hypothetical protein ACROYT_G016050 [Oculina patagonica]
MFDLLPALPLGIKLLHSPPPNGPTAVPVTDLIRKCVYGDKQLKGYAQSLHSVRVKTVQDLDNNKLLAKKNTNDNGDTYIWCSNKCALPFKTANQKVQLFEELMLCLHADLVYPKCPPNCKHDETCNLFILAVKKISNPDLQDALFFFLCPTKSKEIRPTMRDLAKNLETKEAEIVIMEEEIQHLERNVQDGTDQSSSEED